MKSIMNQLAALIILIVYAIGIPVQANDGRKFEFTVYSQIMEYKMMDGGNDGRGMADLMATNNTLHKSVDGLVVGTADTSMIITKAASQPGGLETRLFKMIMTFPNPGDTVVVDGISTAAVPDNWMIANQPSYRAVVGGTGRFNGARGQAIYTRIDSAWVRIDMKFYVLSGAKSAVFPK
ncbi:MAG: hypothetical protein RL333_727 [Pseudomonadota bacterium]|jgi:hypothetical protein